LEATIAKPKALESLQKTKQQKRKKGTNHLKPIAEYFVKVQAFPLTGFPTAEGVITLSGNFQSATLLLNMSLVLMVLKCFTQ